MKPFLLAYWAAWGSHYRTRQSGFRYYKNMVEDILAENIIRQKWEIYWSKTIDRKDSSNSMNKYRYVQIGRNILVKFAYILHPNTFPEKANPFFKCLEVFPVLGRVSSVWRCGYYLMILMNLMNSVLWGPAGIKYKLWLFSLCSDPKATYIKWSWYRG